MVKSFCNKIWNFPAPCKEKVEEIKSVVRSNLLAKILVNRGFGNAEEVNAFIQKNQQKNINNPINENKSQTELQPKIITPTPSSLNQPQINTNINPNINININPNIPIQTNIPPMYPSQYPMILPQNQNPQFMYGVPYGMYPGTGYPIPVQNQFGSYTTPQMEQNLEKKNEKKKVNYKPK